MEKYRWLRFTIIQVVAFIAIVATLEMLIFKEEFRPEKFLIGAVIYGAIMGFFNYRKAKKQ